MDLEDFNLSILNYLSASMYGYIIHVCLHKLVKQFELSTIENDKIMICDIIKQNYQDSFELLSKFEGLTFKDYEEVLYVCFEGLKKTLRVSSNNIDLSIQHRYNSLINLQAKLFALSSDIDKRTKTSNLTPFRSNLYTIGGLWTSDNNDGLAMQEHEARVNFAENYWISCSCKRMCHTQVPFNDAFNLNYEYSRKSKKDTFKQLGSVLENLRRGLDDVNNMRSHAFGYVVGGKHVCQGFFLYV